MADIQRDAPLFDKLIPIEICNGGDNTRSASLTMRILTGTRNTIGANQPEKLFRVEVTEESDPYFLYYLDIGELDFHHLKRDQSIRVEFSVFPTKLIELVDLCCASATRNIAAVGNDGERSELSLQGSSYLARLDLINGQLSVFELNVFKELLHISLTLRPGNDSAIKSYLASRLYYSLMEGDKHRVEIATLRHSLIECQQECTGLASSLTEARNFREVDVQSLKSLHATELSQVRVSSMEAMESLRMKNDVQVNELRDQMETIRNNSENRIFQLDAKILGLSQDKSELEYQVNDLSRKLSIAESSRTRANDDLSQMTLERRGVEEERSRLEREAARLGAKVEALQQQVKDKDEMLAQATAFNRATEDARAAIEEKLLGTQANCDNLQDRLKAGAAELVKGNQEIRRLQQENRDAREKLRTKCEVIRRQESVVQDLRAKLSDTEKQLLESKDATRSLGQQNALLKKQIEEDKLKFEESVNVIANNKEIITYLNEEISKWQLGMRVQGDVGMMHNYVSPSNQTSFMPSSLESKLEDRPSSSNSSKAAMNTVHSVSFNESPDTITAKYTPGGYTTRYKSGTTTSSSVNTVNRENPYLKGFGSSSSGSIPVPDKDILMQGVRNLGLGDTFGDLDALDVGLVGLDFDLEHGHESYYSNPYDAISTNKTKRLTKQDVDLESVDYYSTNASPPTRPNAALSRR